MIVDDLLRRMREGEIALIEYEPTSVPEVIFYGIVRHFVARDVPILVVDVVDTLHLFNEHLKMKGLKLPLERLSVVKEGGRVRLGKVLGEVFLPSEPSEFTYHQVQYSRTVRSFFMAEPDKVKVIIVLGMEKFILPFQNDLRKVEMYFEIIERPLIAPKKKFTFLFINRGAASDYVLKDLESEKHFVVELVKEAKIVKGVR